jgi:predicted  nucleic acid-binding Zn-ribbon protein
MTTQLENNIKQSFSFVKKDLLDVNDTIADLKTKIQHLSMNQASLLSVMEQLKEEFYSIRDKNNSKKKKKK